MLLVVGWDGACFELVDALRAAGRLPVLDALMRRGRAWRVRSTTPAVTFPAWTSFLTAAPPERHGVTDFTVPRDGAYAVRFVNASDRRLPTLSARMARAGLRVGVYGVPATYPPEGEAVFEICGFDTPLGTSGAARATHPPALGEAIRRRHGRLGIEGLPQSRIDAGWHERAAGQLVADVELRTRIAVELLEEHRLDAFVVHFMEPDTASHHFWQFHDDASPRHRAGPADALARVYEALDASLGTLLAAAGNDADVLLLSDHGSAGASDRVLLWNRWLADRGWLRFRDGTREDPAARLKRHALGLLPPSLQARAFAWAGRLADRLESRARFAGIDWAATRAFSDELPYFPSIRLNVAAREPSGVVAAAARDETLGALERDLLAMRDPFDGGPVVEAVHRREHLFDGPFAHRYPDLVLELRRPDGYAYGALPSRGGLERDWMRRLTAAESVGAKGSATSGVHSRFGMAVAAGPRLAASPAARAGNGGNPAGDECTLPDLGATALAMAGLSSWPSPARSLLDGAVGDEEGGVAGATPREYDEGEEKEVEERLRALGYLP